MRTLDQLRSPLSSIPLPTTNGPTNRERTENRTSLDLTKSSDFSSPPLDEPLTGYLGEQQDLSTAERLLSRSLATACADNGVTLNAELGPNYSSTSSMSTDPTLEPTQMHILIQAPRRFHHPSWIPRQNMSPRLESVLDELRGHERMGGKGRASVKTDEVVIRCDYAKVSAAESDKPEGVEVDDLIWWSWDGKIVGFGDL